MLRKKKIDTILFETKGLTSIGSASRESTPTSWLCKREWAKGAFSDLESRRCRLCAMPDLRIASIP